MRSSASLLSLLTLGTLAAPPVHAQWSTAGLGEARQNPARVTVDGFSLFAGGRDGNSISGLVDIHDSVGDRWSSSGFTVPRTTVAATAIGHLARFAGGAGFNTSDALAISFVP